MVENNRYREEEKEELEQEQEVVQEVQDEKGHCEKKNVRGTIARNNTVKLKRGKKLVSYFAEQPKTKRNVIYYNLTWVSLLDDFYSVEVHELLDQIQQGQTIDVCGVSYKNHISKDNRTYI